MKNLILILLMFIAQIIAAQEFSNREIRGVFLDDTNNPIYGVKVCELGAENSVVTNSSGEFKIPCEYPSPLLTFEVNGFPMLYYQDTRPDTRAAVNVGNKLEVMDFSDPLFFRLMATKNKFLGYETVVNQENEQEVLFQPIFGKASKYEMVEKTFSVSDGTATRLEVIPAVYETVSEQYEIGPIYRIKQVPPVYDTITTKVLLKEGSKQVDTTKTMENGREVFIIKETEFPAEHEITTRYVVKTPATTKIVQSASKQQEYGTRTMRRVVTPASTKVLTTPSKTMKIPVLQRKKIE